MTYHFTIARSLLRRMAEKHPDEILLSLGGRDLKGAEAIKALDSMPPEKINVTDCPTPDETGTCPGHDE